MASSLGGAPYLRRMKVQLGPLEEYKGAGSGAVVEFMSDGTRKGLRVSAQITSSLMSPAFSNITIYNLSESTRNSITKGETKVQLFAGWYNTDLVKVFQGSLLNVWHERSGADILTHLICMPAYGSLARGSTAIRFAPGTPLQNAIERLIKDLPGLKFNKDNLAGISGNIGSRGFSYGGTTKGALTKLAEEYGFSWFVKDEFVGAVADDFTIPAAITIGPDSGLINVSPILQGPLQVAVGVRIKSLFIPGMRAGAGISVSSKLYPSLNGKPVTIMQCSTSLDCYSDSWTCDMETRWFG